MPGFRATRPTSVVIALPLLLLLSVGPLSGEERGEPTPPSRKGGAVPLRLDEVIFFSDYIFHGEVISCDYDKKRKRADCRLKVLEKLKGDPGEERTVDFGTDPAGPMYVTPLKKGQKPIVALLERNTLIFHPSLLIPPSRIDIVRRAASLQKGLSDSFAYAHIRPGTAAAAFFAGAGSSRAVDYLVHLVGSEGQGLQRKTAVEFLARIVDYYLGHRAELDPAQGFSHGEARKGLLSLAAVSGEEGEVGDFIRKYFKLASGKNYGRRSAKWRAWVESVLPQNPSPPAPPTNPRPSGKKVRGKTSPGG